MEPTDLLSAPSGASPARIRRRALWKIALGAILAPGVFEVFRLLDASPQLRVYQRVVAIAGGALCLPLLVGLLELVSGMRLAELAARWDSLAGWQRGVLGLVIVAIAFALLGVGIVAYARIASP